MFAFSMVVLPARLDGNESEDGQVWVGRRMVRANARRKIKGMTVDGKIYRM